MNNGNGSIFSHWMRNKKICGECKWHEKEDYAFSWICCNNESDYVTDWTDYNHTCEFWEKME